MDEPVPKLEDVLDWARESGACLSLDLKTSFIPEGRLSQKVIDVLGKTNSKNIVLLLFPDHNELFQVKKSYPDLSVRALSRGRIVNYAQYLQFIRADCASISYDLLRPVDIEQIHAVGISVVLDSVWNPNVDLFETLDIDILTHDDPLDAKRILKYE